MRLERFERLAQGEAGGDDVLDDDDLVGRRDLEAATQRELAVLALHEDRLGAKMAGGLIAGHDAPDGRRDDDVDLAVLRLDLGGQRLAKLFGALGVLEDEHLLQENRAAATRGQDEMTFEQCAGLPEFLEHFVLVHLTRSNLS